jgi:hypothetical protein
MSENPKTEFGYVPSLALFEKPSVESGIISYKWVQYRPISQISTSNNLQFTISGSSKFYVNLKNTYLQIRGQICSLSTHQPISDRDEVALENLPLQTLWRQVDISLQQNVINSKVGTNYAYKAYLDVLLNNTTDVMKNQLTSQLFIKDIAQTFDSPINNGYRGRKKNTSKGKEIQLEGPIYIDIGAQERPIINGVEIKFDFWPNKPQFTLASSSEEYYFRINDAVLNVCMVEVSPAILIGHAAAINESDAIYPYMQSNLKAFSIPEGQYEYTIDNIFQGEVPADVVVGLVSSRAYSGAYDKNPFNFHNYDCGYCGFYVNDTPTPSQPFQPLYYNSPNKGRTRRSAQEPPSNRGPDIPPSERPPSELPGAHIVPNYAAGLDVDVDNSAYVNSYLSLFGQRYHTGKNIPISMEEYPYGYCLYKFQVSEVPGEYGEFVTLPRRGHTKLTVKFRKALPEPVTLIAYAHFPRTLKIDAARNVTT